MFTPQKDGIGLDVGMVGGANKLEVNINKTTHPEKRTLWISLQ
jgi:hypothetical protein